MTSLVFEPSKTTHWKNLFPSKTLLLGSHNLNEGEELVATIQSVEIQEIVSTSGQKERVPVVRFTNAPPMVLNITNSRTIASLYGERYDEWPGKSIQIFATKVKAFGVEQMALRIRETIPDTGQDVSRYEEALRSCGDLDSLKKAFFDIPKHLRKKLEPVKDEMKEKIDAAQN